MAESRTPSWSLAFEARLSPGASPSPPCVPGERPFVCLICLSAFTTKANCERHLKVHTDTLSGRWAAGGGEGLWGHASAPGP
jgi:hypothetical protein